MKALLALEKKALANIRKTPVTPAPRDFINNIDESRTLERTLVVGIENRCRMRDGEALIRQIGRAIGKL